MRSLFSISCGSRSTKTQMSFGIIQLGKTPAWTPAGFPISIQKCRVVCPTRPKRLSPRYFWKSGVGQKINRHDRRWRIPKFERVRFSARGARPLAPRSSTRAAGNMLTTAREWFERTFVDLFRQLRWSFLPPLMVYFAAGISGLTAIVGTFFVKEYLGLSAAFLAALTFWAGLPWALKMPLGHLVDLVWRWKALLVYLGAALIAASLVIMYALIMHTEAMRQMLSVEAWFVREQPARTSRLRGAGHGCGCHVGGGGAARRRRRPAAVGGGDQGAPYHDADARPHCADWRAGVRRPAQHRDVRRRGEPGAEARRPTSTPAST